MSEKEMIWKESN